MSEQAPRTSARRIGWVLAAVLVAVLAFWAGRVTLMPPPVAGDLPASDVFVEVTEQTVGRQLALNVTVSQPTRPLATNALPGVVTQIHPDGEVTQGAVLYRVGGVPVRAVRGEVPFHRALGPNASGDDVRQLQDALVELTLLGSASGTYGPSTVRAVRAWQKNLGMPQADAVALGELVAVPRLPAPLRLDPATISLGAALTGGEKIVLGAAGEPRFVLRLSQQQARLVPATSLISMEHRGHRWNAVIASSEQDERGDTVFELRAPDGGPVCGADCAAVTAGEEVSILSQVAVVAPATGPAVPVAAVTTRPDGTAFVRVDDGGVRTERTVTVRGSQNGVAVVDGVRPGERVQVLAGSTPTPRGR